MPHSFSGDERKTNYKKNSIPYLIEYRSKYKQLELDLPELRLQHIKIFLFAFYFQSTIAKAVAR